VPTLFWILCPVPLIPLCHASLLHFLYTVLLPLSCFILGGSLTTEGSVQTPWCQKGDILSPDSSIVNITLLKKCWLIKKSFISGSELILSAGNDDAGQNIILDATSLSHLPSVPLLTPLLLYIYFARQKRSFSDQTSKWKEELKKNHVTELWFIRNVKYKFSPCSHRTRIRATGEHWSMDALVSEGPLHTIIVLICIKHNAYVCWGT
jgi:hypothetical protein